MGKGTKSIGRILRTSLFYIILLVILYIFFLSKEIGLLLSAILLTGFIISYIPSLSSKRRLIKFLNQYDKIEDKFIAKKLDRSVSKIRSQMHNLSKRQKHKKWLIVFLNKRYIYYSQDTIEKFLYLYENGYHEKKILENMKKKSDLKTRAEIKAIEDALSSNKRLIDNNKKIIGKKSITSVET
ncbi:MAG: hypothetical protein ACFE8M_11955 [Candidatus Hermodarchaeota archaeon]